MCLSLVECKHCHGVVLVGVTALRLITLHQFSFYSRLYAFSI